MAQKILVTGANRGIGLELARQYADAGWTVHACCRDPGGAAELGALSSRQISSGQGGAVLVHRLNVSDPKEIAALSDKLRGEALDILLNNAGVGEPKGQAFGHTDEAAWLEAFRVNTVAPLKMAEAFLENILKGRGRTIASISSIMGSIASSNGGSYIYRSTKAALNMVMRSLAMDLRHAGVKVVCLHPGWVRTRMGGPAAPVSPEESVSGIRARLDELGLEDSGKFITFRGEEIPW